MEIAHKSVLLKETLKYLSPLDLVDILQDTNIAPAPATTTTTDIGTAQDIATKTAPTTNIDAAPNIATATLSTGSYKGNAPFMIDCNLGEGGHTKAFLQEYPFLHITGIDADATIMEVAKQRLKDYKTRLDFFCGWSDVFFNDFNKGNKKADIILFDLGISNFHYQKSNRGFSFSKQEPLDMRLSPSAKQTAADIVNTYSQDDLANLIYLYGGEKFSRKIANAIIKYRHLNLIKTSKQLADIIYDSVPAFYQHQRLHPATKTFQALRIQVNGELKRLPLSLMGAFCALSIGGKMGVITFHSLEDKIVKLFFSNLCKDCICPPSVALCDCGGCAVATPLFKKIIEPTPQEIQQNPASRSAKFRAIKKIAQCSQKRCQYIMQTISGGRQ